MEVGSTTHCNLDMYIPKQSSYVSEVEAIVLPLHRWEEEGAKLMVDLNSHANQLLSHISHGRGGEVSGKNFGKDGLQI